MLLPLPPQRHLLIPIRHNLNPMPINQHLGAHPIPIRSRAPIRQLHHPILLPIHLLHLLPLRLILVFLVLIIAPLILPIAPPCIVPRDS